MEQSMLNEVILEIATLGGGAASIIVLARNAMSEEKYLKACEYLQII